MHENYLPRTINLRGVAAKKIFLRVLQTRIERVKLGKLRIQHKKMRRAVVERIKIAAEFLRAVRRQRKLIKVINRQGIKPIDAVTFMIAHDWRKRSLR